MLPEHELLATSAEWRIDEKHELRDFREQKRKDKNWEEHDNFRGNSKWKQGHRDREKKTNNGLQNLFETPSNLVIHFLAQT